MDKRHSLDHRNYSEVCNGNLMRFSLFHSRFTNTKYLVMLGSVVSVHIFCEVRGDSPAQHLYELYM